MPPPQPPRSQQRTHCSDLDQLHHQTCLCTQVFASFVTNLRGVTVTGSPVSTRRARPPDPTKLLPPRDVGRPWMKAHLPGSGSHLLLAEPAPGTSTARAHRTGVPDCPPRGQAERCSGVGPGGLHGDPSTSRGRSRSKGPLSAPAHLRSRTRVCIYDVRKHHSSVFNRFKKFKRPPWWLGGEESPCQGWRHEFSPWSREARAPRLLRLRSRFWETQTLKRGRPGPPPSTRTVATAARGPHTAAKDPAQPKTSQLIYFLKTCNARFTGQ